MEVGAGVWIRDIDLSWISSTVVSKEHEGAGSYKIVVDTGESKREFIFRFDDSDGGSHEHDGIKLQNDPCDATVEDLINLPYLHEPAILHCLQNRYVGGNIYTYTGPILIALNPFKSVPLYSPHILESYYNYGLLKSQGIDGCRPLPPHVYAVADAAYRDMMRVVSQNLTAKSPAAVNQTILISGESGAGKTESTKIVLRYLTTVGSSSGSSSFLTGSVMDKVLQSNPILESFGNARTLRNDNSSRFGKFIELHFSKRGHLIGGTIRTYLLERVRLVAQQQGERNFHVMYQLLAGCSSDERSAWQLTCAQDYWCCNQGSVFVLRSVDDAEEFSSLRTALTTLNFTNADQQSLFGAVAGVLHLSEVSFDEDGDGCVVSQAPKVLSHFASFARLCGLSTDQLQRVLTVRAMVAKDDSYEIRLTREQAMEARDALSKALYSRLFEWIVLRVNDSIRVGDVAQVRADIGVLDIFGFESFVTNSFEQLCINYTNETLQQQFNQFVFKLEQSEYQREQISWSFIEFPDNQDCLDLIEHKQNGILAVLDDVCKLGQASDEKFANRLYKLLVSNTRFSANTAQKRDLLFCVTHYAGPVEYLATSFVEKNKNELPKEAISLFRISTLPLIASIFSETWSPLGIKSAPKAAVQTPSHMSGNSNGAGSKVASVSTQFKMQLAELMSKVSSTMPHYIRCLKPNDENVPDKFHRRRTTEQLRYGGVLEAVRVARSGFPVRLSHTDFFSRYSILVDPINKTKTNTKTKRHSAAGSVKEALSPSLSLALSEKERVERSCKSLMLTLWEHDSSAGHGSSTADGACDGSSVLAPSKGSLSPSSKETVGSRDGIQWGLTKVFLRKTAHDTLEGRRSTKLRTAACKLQSWYRGHLVRLLYLETLRAISLIQRMSRGLAVRRRVQGLRWDRAVVKMQARWRASQASRKFLRFLRALTALQSCCRRRKAKKRASAVATLKNAVRLQRMLRGAVARIKWKRMRRAVLALQCAMRRRLAKKHLKSMRREAKDLGKLQQSNEALKEEIELLRARAKDDTRRVLVEAGERSVAAAMEELVQLRIDLKAARMELEHERCASRSLEDKLAMAESDFLKATKQIIGLRGMIATEESDGEGHGEGKGEGDVEGGSEDRDLASTPPPARHSNCLPICSGGRAHSRVQRASLKRQKRVLRAGLSTMQPRDDSALPPADDPSGLKGRQQEGVGGVWSSRQLSEQPESYRHATVAPSKLSQSRKRLSPCSPVASPESCLAAFEQNLAGLQARLRLGMRVRLWEEGPGCHVHSFDCVVALDSSSEVLTFSAASVRRGTFSLFAQRADVQPIRIADMLDCVSNTSSFFSAVDGQNVGLLSVFKGVKQPPDALTIVARSRPLAVRPAGAEAPRVVSLKVAQREDKNFLLCALRTLISICPGERAAQQSSVAPTFSESVSRDEDGESEGEGRHCEEPTPSPSPSPSLLESPRLCGSPVGAIVTIADQKCEKGLRRVCAIGAAEGGAGGVIESAAELRSQLAKERLHYERLLLQVFAHTNDLNEKDDTIAHLKMREASLEGLLAANDRMHEQDAIVRLQLGKRLEQVLLDKEEAYEELDLFKDKLESIQSAMSVIGFSKSSSITTSSASSPRS